MLGHDFFITWSLELPERRTPWSVGKVPYKRGGHVGTSSIHVGIRTREEVVAKQLLMVNLF